MEKLVYKLNDISDSKHKKIFWKILYLFRMVYLSVLAESAKRKPDAGVEPATL